MTDPVYEGKSMQGLIDLVRKGFFPAGSKVLYAHLGGRPRDQRLQLRLPQRLTAPARSVAIPRRATAGPRSSETNAWTGSRTPCRRNGNRGSR